MWESLDRRLEVLAREIAAGPKLKDGFTVTHDGKLCYMNPADLHFACKHKSDYRGVDPVVAESATVFKVGDRVQVRCEVWCSYYSAGNVGTVTTVSLDKVLVEFDPRQQGLDPGGDVCWWVMKRDLEHYSPATFDPMTEPLRVGDLAEVVLEYSKKGHVGKVLTSIFGGIPPHCGSDVCWVKVEGIETPFIRRSSLKLIEKAKT